MRYHNITKADMLNGEGLRVVLWTSGCDHHCQACQNVGTWNAAAGLLFDEAAKQEIFAELDQDWCCGLTLSGGDPLFLENRSSIQLLVTEIKEKYPDKTIWCYTGYCWDELLEQAQEDLVLARILEHVDVLLDGKFVLRLALEQLQYVGSSNQQIIDVQKSFAQKEKILYINNEEMIGDVC